MYFYTDRSVVNTQPVLLKIRKQYLNVLRFIILSMLLEVLKVEVCTGQVPQMMYGLRPGSSDSHQTLYRTFWAP
jgi:hypothetical protein